MVAALSSMFKKLNHRQHRQQANRGPQGEFFGMIIRPNGLFQVNYGRSKGLTALTMLTIFVRPAKPTSSILSACLGVPHD
jgi:hypothetical protein